jgi:RNA polymerase sigma-70 factor (ECF subfamily)
MTNWDAIVGGEGPRVWRTLWRLLGDRADVEDCFQETFLAALALSRRERVDCWSAALSTLATARAIDRLRGRYRQRRHQAASEQGLGVPLAELVSTEASPEQRAVATELSDRLREALTRLPERQAEVFCLHALDGWTYRELSEALQMTESAIGVTIHRARQRLRELLGEVS